MLLNRIRPILNPLLRNNQNGFRQERTTVGQILAIRRILEGVKSKNVETIWKSKTYLPLKRRLFVATVESVLLYGSESWTLNVKQQNSLDGQYTRMLRKALNKNGRNT